MACNTTDGLIYWCTLPEGKNNGYDAVILKVGKEWQNHGE